MSDSHTQHEEQISSYISNDAPPSAPPAEESNNGFEQIEKNEIENAVDSAVNTVTKQVDQATAEVVKKVEEEDKPAKTAEPAKKICTACPYTFLGGACFNKMLTVSFLPQNVQDLVLWKCPKYTGTVFGTSLILLLSMTSCSLLTVASALLLLAMTIIGLYRLYLSVLFRIKGTYDETFDKASAFDLSLPKDKIQEFAQLLDSDLNQSLNQVKAIVLWDNVCKSFGAYVALYFVYCIGATFNFMTLLIIGLVKLFTIPKVYQMYKVQIDQGFEKAMKAGHDLARQIEAKIPPQAMQFLHKFKRD
jgi:hypothetical protein